MFVVLSAVVQVVFAAAFGACVGSLINVLVYRLPLGLGVVTPSSRCPSCATKLTWRENVPIFGWLALRGRCRFCRSPISSEYPLVEAFVATLFALITLAWFALPADTQVLGVAMESVRPEWTLNGFPKVWPAYIAVLTLVSCLVAMTLIDAKTFTIPLVLAYVPVVAAVVFHLVLVLIAGDRGLRYTAPGYEWIIPEPGPAGWAWAGVATGGVLGLAISCGLLELGWLRRSFADYEQWEAEAIKQAEAEAAASGRSDDAQPVTPETLWIQYPHARREMFKELLFLAPAIVLGILGYSAGHAIGGPWTFDPDAGVLMPASELPMWARALAGIGLGFLAGGGAVWAMRILGTLAFGKEALGLGDAHLMAGVGAVLGWIDPVLAFFLAAFVGVGAEAVRGVFSGGLKRMMPYGPYLAAATLIVVLAKPLVEIVLGKLGHTTINLP